MSITTVRSRPAGVLILMNQARSSIVPQDKRTRGADPPTKFLGGGIRRFDELASVGSRFTNILEILTAGQAP